MCRDKSDHYGESWLIQQHDDPKSDVDLSADVLFVAHHGSANATSQEFLERVDPELAGISSDLGKKHDHPTDEVLKNLHEHDIAVTWTAGHGTTRIDLDGALSTERTTDLETTSPSDLAALKYYCREHDVSPERVKTLAPAHLPEQTPEWVADSAPILAETAEEIVEAAITNADTVEDIRQTLEEHPAATDHLETIVETDREEHVTTPDDVEANRRRYAAAKQQANRTPTLIERVQGTLPARFGGTNGAHQPDDPADAVDGPIKQTELPRAVRTAQTAASQRAMGVSPADHLLDAEQTADTAVETAETAGELCWGLRQTLGAHKDFLYASTTENAHETEKELAGSHTATKEAATDKHHDEDKGRGMGL